MKSLDKLLNDPKVKEAKKLLTEALSNHSRHIGKPKDPDPDLAQDFEKLLESYGQMRGGPLFYPYIGSGLGKGALVELMDGSVKYDFITGIGVHGFGHSHPDIVSSSIDAALTDTVMEGHLQQNSDAYELTKLLIDISGLDHCFLSSTGAMANENALKICFQKKYPANRILAFERCFMGRTLALSQVTDKPMFREGLPLNQPVDYVPFYNPENPKESTELAVKTLTSHIDRYPGKHAAMSFELIQGEGGFNLGTPEFFKALMDILKDRGIPVMIDEVQTFGRTTKPLAFQHFGLEDYVDVVTIGKLSQACATLYKSHLKPGPGLLSQTFTTSSSAIRASKVIIEKLVSEGHFGEDGKNMAIHKYFVEKLKSIGKKHPGLVQGPYGIGCMIAFTPLDGGSAQVVDFARELFKQGVMSFIAGKSPVRCRFLVPMLAVTNHDIDKAAEIIEKTLLICKERHS
jgi:acetylornithine/N-succinyldiaminopimelate aminotransferase